MLGSSATLMWILTLSGVLCLINISLPLISAFSGFLDGYDFQDELFGQFGDLFWLFGLGSVGFFAILLGYWRAPVVNGMAFKCVPCRWEWSQFNSFPVQNPEHIRYITTRYSQSFLIEGVQCPNPECQSLEVVSSAGFLALTYNPLMLLLRHKYTQTFIVYCFLIGIFDSIFNIFATLDAFQFILNGMIVVSLAAYGIFVGMIVWYRRRQQFRGGRLFDCPACKYHWQSIPRQEVLDHYLKYIEEGARRAHRRKNKKLEAGATIDLASALGSYRDEWEKSLTLGRQALALAEQTPDKRLLAICQTVLGIALRETGQHPEAIEVLENAGRMARETKNWGLYGYSLAMLGLTLVFSGQTERARPLFFESIWFLRRAEGFRGEDILWCLEGLALIALIEREVPRAVRLLAATQALRDTHSLKISSNRQKRFDDMLESARNRLEMTRFMLAWHEGSQLNLDAALLYSTTSSQPVG